MPYGRLMWVMDGWRRMNAPADGTRQATQEDIERFFG